MSLARYAKQRYNQPAQAKREHSAPPVDIDEPKPTTLNDLGPVATDPRPDLAADSDLWVCLLAESTKYADRRLYDNLYALRKVGTVISKVGGKLKFRPVIGQGGWRSEADYKGVINSWLINHGPRLVTMLATADRLRNTLQRLS